MKPKEREIFFIMVRDILEFIKNIQLMKTGVEKYLGWIADQQLPERPKSGE